MPSPAPRVLSYPESAVLIAGGTSGVGLASALAFADAGVRRLALLARDPERGEAARRPVARHCPDAQVVFVAADAGDADQVQAAITEAHHALGAIDVLVSSVTGTYRPELLHRTAMADIAGILLTQALPPARTTSYGSTPVSQRRSTVPVAASNSASRFDRFNTT